MGGKRQASLGSSVRDAPCSHVRAKDTTTRLERDSAPAGDARPQDVAGHGPKEFMAQDHQLRLSPRG
ncbi:hypothetical protein TVNIR_2176 [Thioalkalivibrio nitratireducens DSM 14787]|uniref:Uncharacterized protein n=1 Tax=Thioalkalivibrio nitratireducens (strain DSM 14787 / UNIQEM 213 / ALEN2) TaxID=1255043 RepID=L0DXU2_THIND|nr:hypothetical protein TVNIR_2176 [Thioalkalivibrio nitratireducens DSM 14787]